MLNLKVKKNIELKSSWEWIKSSFYTFRESPVHFILLSLVGVILGFIPLFGAFMSPLFTARFALLAGKVEDGEKLKISSLFNGFFANISLVRLSFLNFTLNAIFFIGQYLIEAYFKSTGQSEGVGQGLTVLILSIPLMVLQVALWISPVICLNHPEIRPASAMGLSLKVGLYNVITLLLYSLLLLVFTLLALLPVGLGLLIWLPVLNIVAYYVYKSTIENNTL